MAKVVIDEIDKKILRYLTRNARMPFLEIARECGISGAAIHQRVKKLDEAGVILGSRLEVNPKSLGFDVCAIVGIRITDPTRYQETVDKLLEMTEIVECHFITGKYNLLIKLYCLNNEHLMNTIFKGVLGISWVSGTETFISLTEAFSRQVDVDMIKD
jgi:Lrp/AsnC family transcriptional regulator for asnA, asnC and gidA